jgi:hypothetical protein
MDDPPQTPIQASIAATGRRWFAVAPAVYPGLRQAVDAARDYPIGEGSRAVTTSGLPAPDALPVATDGRLLISLETHRFTPADDAMLAPAIAAGLVEEMTAEAFATLQQPAPLP